VVVAGLDLGGNMTFFERGDEHVRTYAQVHNGEGAIEISRLFRDRLTLPVHVQIWELEPGVSEGDHTHPSDDPADNYEELYYVLAGSGTLTVDGSRHALAVGDAVLVPTDIDHGLYADRGESLRILLIFGKPPAGAPSAP
jgi:quercetin dioxygenase-like cupin family protein